MTLIKPSSVFFSSFLLTVLLFSAVSLCASDSLPTAQTHPVNSTSDSRNKVSTRKSNKAVVRQFKGVGNKNGTLDTEFRRMKHKLPKKLEEEKQSTITFDPGTQKFIDGAGKTIKNIDKATLNAVNAPLNYLGLDAESASIRPMNGGVGLGISINLHKDKKKNPQSDEKSDADEVYDLIAPQPEDGTSSRH